MVTVFINGVLVAGSLHSVWRDFVAGDCCAEYSNSNLLVIDAR